MKIKLIMLFIFKFNNSSPLALEVPKQKQTNKQTQNKVKKIKHLGQKSYFTLSKILRLQKEEQESEGVKKPLYMTRRN